MSLAIMQPYFFPYLGYFQLIYAVEKFVFYDDVAFIKQGWINRNYILLNKQKHLITVPIEGISSFRNINVVGIAGNDVNWRRKILKTLQTAYCKAPQYTEVFPLIEGVINTPFENIGELAKSSVKMVTTYLGIHTKIVDNSAGYNNQHLKGEERVIDICKRENAGTYINSIGGQQLYGKSQFQTAFVELKFLESASPVYHQYDGTFTPGLSIIDVMMFNDIAAIKVMLHQFKLL